MKALRDLKQFYMKITISNGYLTGADLEIFDRGGLIDYPMGIYKNLGHRPTKIVAN